MRLTSRLATMLAGLSVLTGACAGPARPHVTVLPPRLDAPLPASATADAPRPATAIADAALAYLGTPYQLGGTTPSGFDCSGLVWYVFAQGGTRLPRELRLQFEAGEPVPQSDIRPGDLLFFSTTGPGPTHVGISTGGDEFIHAPNSRGVVRLDRLSTAYWASHFIGAHRVISGTRSN
jgi:cell wall-associated NlpC family hydrolase